MRGQAGGELRRPGTRYGLGHRNVGDPRESPEPQPRRRDGEGLGAARPARGWWTRSCQLTTHSHAETATVAAAAVRRTDLVSTQTAVSLLAADSSAAAWEPGVRSQQACPRPVIMRLIQHQAPGREGVPHGCPTPSVRPCRRSPTHHHPSSSQPQRPTPPRHCPSGCPEGCQRWCLPTAASPAGTSPFRPPTGHLRGTNSAHIVLSRHPWPHVTDKETEARRGGWVSGRED